LTNFKHLTVSIKEKLSFNDRKNPFFFMPSVLIFYDVSSTKWALFEGSSLDIPIFSFLDTSSLFFNLLNYPVVANTKSLDSLSFYSYLFRNSLLKGRQQERLKTLKIF
jgi:ribosomal protein S2